jgi:hypothetical protein
MPRKPKKPTEAAKAALASILPMPGVAHGQPPAEPEVKVTPPKAEHLRKLVANPPPRPSLQAFLDHWFAVRGGPAQFALDLCQEFDAADPGSLVRSQITTLVLRSMKVADAKEGALDELGLLSDADLDRQLALLGEKLTAEPESPK